MIQPAPHPARRGGVSFGAVLLVLVFLVFAVGGCGVSKYNGMIASQEGVNAAWSEIDNQYQRRADLVPQLVETVKGAAEFEKDLLTELTEARAKVGQARLPDTMPTDPEQVRAYVEAQRGLGSALGRLFAVAENYPDLKATAAFMSLQDQLEGTENRIAVARRDYIEMVRSYNTSIRKFPNSLLAGFGNFERAAELEFDLDEESRKAPKIDFGGGKDDE